MRDPKLTDQELASGLETLPDWKLENGKLHRQYKFSDFAQAIGFMMTATPKIEKLDHHPEWANVYNRVTVDLTTHDSGGVTKRDLELAGILEGIAKKFL